MNDVVWQPADGIVLAGRSLAGCWIGDTRQREFAGVPAEGGGYIASSGPYAISTIEFRYPVIVLLVTGERLEVAAPTSREEALELVSNAGHVMAGAIPPGAMGPMTVTPEPGKPSLDLVE